MKKDRSQTRKKQTGQGSNSRKRPDTKAPPPLSVVDARARQKIPARLESHRLAPMSAVGMLVMTLLTAGFIMAERTGLIAISLNYKAGINAFSLRGLLLGGLIPLVTASLLIVIYRPTAEFILGTRPDRVSCFLAPVTGLLMGWLVWGGVEFVRSWSPRAADWIAIPKLWEISGLYLGRSPLYSALVMIVAVVIPATSGELAFRGLVLPSYMGQRRRMGSVVLPALFSAFIMLDVSGAAVFLMAALMASWIRLAADSLIASALSTAGFAVAMLYARSLFTRISQAIFGMPLIDPVRVRIFLVTWSLILLVLLFVPTALINSAGRKAVPRGRLASNQQGQRPFAKSNAVVALICIGVMVAGLLWLV